MAPEIRHFDEQLEDLKQKLLTMGTLVEDHLDASLRGLLARDSTALTEVIWGDAEVNRLHLEVDDRCFKLLALQQPAAIDLRFLVASSKIAADLERVGDLAVNIAESAERYLKHPPVKPLVDLPRMVEIARRMLNAALIAFVSQDSEIARSVLATDDRLDELKSQVFRELLTYMLADPHTIEPAIDLILISRHLERVGDHATNVAEDVIFIAEAKDVRHSGQSFTPNP